MVAVAAMGDLIAGATGVGFGLALGWWAVRALVERRRRPGGSPSPAWGASLGCDDEQEQRPDVAVRR